MFRKETLNVKIRLISRLLILILIAPIICQAQKPKLSANAKKAQELVDNLVKTDYVKATKDFNEEMKTKVTVPKLEEIWTTLIKQAGAFKKQLSTESSKVEDQGKPYEIVLVKCQFERAPANVRVVFDVTSHQVAGLFFAPAS